MINSFPPIIDDKSRILVLGTMPGAESLRQRRYYAYERNHFWRVIFALYGLELPGEYEPRVEFLREKRIALWDVLESCERKTSADADIRNAVPNDIPALLREYSGIRAVFANGNGAARLFKRYGLKQLDPRIHVDTLPSTSPLHMIPFEKKLEGWQKILEYLG